MDDYKKNKSSYWGFSETGREFVDEVLYRTSWAAASLNIANNYRDKKTEDWDEEKEYMTISELSANYAVLQIAIMLDGSGKLSLKLHESDGQYLPQRDRLRKFFQDVPEKDFDIFFTRLEKLCIKYSTLIGKVLEVRHKHLAHASVSSYAKEGRLMPSRFPRRELEDFLMDFSFMFTHAAFGVFDGIIIKK
jgi:hypothetical protein